MKTSMLQAAAVFSTSPARTEVREDLLQPAPPIHGARPRPYSHAAVARLRQLRRTLNIGLVVTEPDWQTEHVRA